MMYPGAGPAFSEGLGGARMRVGDYDNDGAVDVSLRNGVRLCS